MENNIKHVEFAEELKKNYLLYAEEVIKNRTIPELYDGLKPVQRRILWSMYESKQNSSNNFVKCARIVGEVLGKYHPHSDSSVYDALVRMAQDFNLHIPFIEPHGNFGNVDGDSSASYRYTLARLSKFTEDVFFKDIEFNTVEMVDNYEGTEKEPVVLPVRFPTILLSGTSGIAVGMATNFAPYNIKEICQAIIDYIEGKQEYIDNIKAPDFPYGGLINPENIQAFYENKVPVKFRSPFVLEEDKKQKILVINSIPYGIAKSELVEEIAKKISEGKINGIANMRDESNKEGIRIVIIVENNISPEEVVRQLYEKTRLECNINNNMNVIFKGKTKLCSMSDIIKEFVEFRTEIIYKRSVFKKNQLANKIEIINGILLAFKKIDEVVKIVKTSSNPLQSLQDKIGLNKRQAEYIFNLPLRRLSSIEINKIEEEKKEHDKEITYLSSLIENQEERMKIIIQETKEIKEKYGFERKTIIDTFKEINLKPTMKQQKVILQIMKNDYIRSIPFEVQDKYLKQTYIDGNYPKIQTSINNNESLALFTNKGNRYKLNVVDVPLISMGKLPKHFSSTINQGNSEEIIVAIDKWDIEDDESLVLLGKNGLVKRQDTSTIKSLRENTTTIYDVERGGLLVDAKIIKNSENIIVGTKNGMILKKELETLRPVGSRNSAGVNFINLEDKDEVLQFVSNKDISIITKNGFGKILDNDEISVKNSGKSGMIGIKIENDEVIGYNNVEIVDENNMCKKILLEKQNRNTKGKFVGKIKDVVKFL